MKKLSDPVQGWETLREKIIGLGERSFRKSYYPELQKRLAELERFRKLLDQSGDAILLAVAPSGKLTDVNESACRDLGYSRNELLTKNMGELLQGTAAERLAALLQDGEAAPDGSVSLITDLRTSSGTERPFELTMNRVWLDQEGFVVTVAREISERLKAEKELRLLSSAAEQSSEGIAVVDLDWNLIFVNRAFAAVHGYTPRELIGRNLSIFHNPQQLLAVEAANRQLQETGSFSGEIWHVRRDGTEFPALMHNALLRDEEGKPIAMIGTLRDITERKLAEDALRASEAQHRSLIHNSHDAIYLLYKRRFEIVNRKFEEMFGVTQEEVKRPGFDFMELVAPSSRPQIEKRMRSVAGGGQLEPEYEFTAISRDGREVEVEASVTHLPYKNDVAVLGILRDITARKHLEEQLRQSQKMEAMGRLAGGIAHDFNNLLTAIIGYADLYILDVKANDPMRKGLEAVRKAAGQASLLTCQLLAFSRKQVLSPAVLNPEKLINDLKGILKRLIGEDITLTLSHQPGLGSILVDRGQLEQVVLNLAVNARDAMPRGGTLTIETANLEIGEREAEQRLGAKPGPYVTIRVQDTGCGMVRQIVPHIFEPFFTTKETGEGTGLGLSTVFGIVQQSEGHIHVKSEPGEGSIFQICFPRVEAPAEEEAEEERTVDIEEHLRGLETVLLVEDEEVVLDLACSVLRRYGYNVLTAHNAGEALLACERHGGGIDLMVTDVVMPKMSGRELAERLARIRPEMKLLYISGYTADTMSRHGLRGSDAALLPKPFTPVSLARKVREVLDDK